ncbi:MAG: AAA family ATPase [Thermofilaceae archaeon]
MLSRFRLALNAYTLLLYGEALASYCIVFVAALPFYPPPIAWLIVAGLTALLHFSHRAMRSMFIILALPAALYALGPLGVLVWAALATCSSQPKLLPASLALLAVTPYHELGISAALARYAFGPKALAAFLVTLLLTMMSASALVGSYKPLGNSVLLGVPPLERLDTASLGSAFGERIPKWLQLNLGSAGAYLIDPRTYSFIALTAAAVAAARSIHVRVFQVLEERRSFAVLGGLPARLLSPLCAWLAIAGLMGVLGWVYEFMGGEWGLSFLALLPALPIAAAYSLALGSPVSCHKVEAVQPLPVVAAEGARAEEQKQQAGVGGLPKLDDVYDMEQVKARIREILESVRGRKRAYGVILFGPPGTGKSFLAKAMAGELGWPLFEVRAEEILTMWYGESERKLALLLDEVERSAPAVLLIDEMEQVAMARTRRGYVHEVTVRLVDILLRRLQELHDKKVPVLIVGATNVPEEIDPSFLRPGRFDEVIYVPLPDARGRRELWENFLRRTFGDVVADVEELARLSERYSPAEIQYIVERVRERVGGGKPNLDDFVKALNEYRPRITLSSLRRYEELARKYSAVRVEAKPAFVGEVRWDDIGDLEEVKRELRLAVEGPLKHRELAERLGVKLPKGILLYGPPGTGKTTLVKALANELNVTFVTISGDELAKAGPLGAPQLIREKFDLARENAPAILFIDEVEVLARAREASEWRNALSQLLAEMDGLESAQGVVVIGATNKPWELDAAILRPGRFDKLVYVPPPDKEGRMSVLKVLLRGLDVSEDVIERLAAETEYYTPAELKAITERVRRLLFEEALQTGSARTTVTWEDIERARRGMKPRLDPKQLALYELFAKRFSG